MQIHGKVTEPKTLCASQYFDTWAVSTGLMISQELKQLALTGGSHKLLLEEASATFPYAIIVMRAEAQWRRLKSRTLVSIRARAGLASSEKQILEIQLQAASLNLRLEETALQHWTDAPHLLYLVPPALPFLTCPGMRSSLCFADRPSGRLSKENSTEEKYPKNTI